MSNKWNSIYRRELKKLRRKAIKSRPLKRKQKRPVGVKSPIVNPVVKNLPIGLINALVYDVAGNVISSHFYGEGPIPAFYKYKDGVRTTNYRHLAKIGQLPINNYFQKIVRTDGEPYRDDRTNIQTGERYLTLYSNAAYYDTFVPSDFGKTTVSVAEDRCRRKTAKQVNNASVNLGVMFAERKQTAQLIASTAVRIAGAAIALRKGRLADMYAMLSVGSRTPSPKEVRRVLNTPVDKRVANHWLEYSFGWVPLLNDVFGSCEFLADHVRDKASHSQSRASGSYKRQRKEVYNENMYTFIETCKVSTSINYRMDNYARTVLAQTGLNNPLTVAWEVLPYSFVIDWFLPVSGYLQNLMIFDGFEFVDGSKSIVWNCVLTKNFAYTYKGGWRGARSGASYWTENQFSREPLASFLPARPPSFRNPLDKGPLWKFATSMALMRQAFGDGSVRPNLRL